MPDTEGNMTPREFGLPELRLEANADTRKLAARLSGTIGSPDGFVEMDDDYHDWSEDHLYALVDLCGECEWWHDVGDLSENDLSPNGLICPECLDDPHYKVDDAGRPDA